ncbi:MAG: hypothetical protein OSJ72_04265 [Lachnospiraceae bacterium]|nr:hypothetical protein [Lachnospiraceae bacterium]
MEQFPRASHLPAAFCPFPDPLLVLFNACVMIGFPYFLFNLYENRLFVNSFFEAFTEKFTKAFAEIYLDLRPVPHFTAASFLF